MLTYFPNRPPIFFKAKFWFCKFRESFQECKIFTIFFINKFQKFSIKNNSKLIINILTFQ